MTRIDDVIRCLNHALVALTRTKDLTIDAYEGLEKDLARALADAGHLMPDLPGPDETVMPGDCIGWDVGEDLLVQYAPRTSTVALEDFYGHGIRIAPDDARSIAYALLAAADWAEEHDHDQ